VDLDNATLPDAALVMMKTRLLNNWLGTCYTLDEVAGMDNLVFDILGAVKRGLNPPKKDK
jgi:hypothetical protein